jgi:Mn2+/Fe2+ NRAMP family transporter
MAFSGPGLLVAIGYMDPGNWATDIAGGSQFGYRLLSVIFISNLMAILLQSLCVRLGLVTGYDLAQMCRQGFPPLVSFPLWLFAEIAIIACDLAELLGSALAMNLLINSAILIVAAASFHFSGNQQVAEIQDAYQLLTPLLGTSLASVLFGLALLASVGAKLYFHRHAGGADCDGRLFGTADSLLAATADYPQFGDRPCLGWHQLVWRTGYW